MFRRYTTYVVHDCSTIQARVVLGYQKKSKENHNIDKLLSNHESHHPLQHLSSIVEKLGLSTIPPFHNAWNGVVVGVLQLLSCVVNDIFSRSV